MSDRARLTSMRITLATVALLATAVTTLSGCGSDSSSPTRSLPSVDADALPTSYRMVLHADCGERQLIGDFDLHVRDGRVVEAGPTRLMRHTGLELADFPTLAGLVELAVNAEPNAVVDLRVDDAGIPRSLKIDHRPDSLDDEECYRVTGLRPLT